MQHKMILIDTGIIMLKIIMILKEHIIEKNIEHKKNNAVQGYIKYNTQESKNVTENFKTMNFKKIFSFVEIIFLSSLLKKFKTNSKIVILSLPCYAFTMLR